MITDSRLRPIRLATVAAALRAAAWAGLAADDTGPGAGRTIEVWLDDDSIDMAAQLEPGPAVLESTTDGQAEHTITVESATGDAGWTLEEDLLSGETGTLRVDLEAGTCHVWCPIGRHEDYGLHLTLSVGDGGGATGEPAGRAGEGSGASAAASREPVLPKHTPPRPEDLGTATGVKKLVDWFGNVHWLGTGTVMLVAVGCGCRRERAARVLPPPAGGPCGCCLWRPRPSWRPGLFGGAMTYGLDHDAWW